MWEVIPKSWFSWNFKISEGPTTIADLDLSSWREKGSLHIGEDDYDIYRKGLISPTIFFEEKGKLLARAEKSSMFRRGFSIQIDGRDFVLERKSGFRRAFVLSNDLGAIGSVAPISIFTRKATADLPEDLPVPIRLFVVWLVLLSWKRISQNSAGASGGDGG